MTKNKLSVLVFALAAAGVCNAEEAGGQTEATNNGPTVLETIVVTATRDEQTLRMLPASATVVDTQSLDITSHTHIQEALVRVPGANFARGNGQEYLPSLRSAILTGAGGCGSVLTAVDGVPLRASGFCNINELFDGHTEVAERIEVIRGPGSALWGANAMNGVINVISPRVTDEPEYRLGVEGGPHDYMRMKFSASRRMGDHGLRADLSMGHDGGYRHDSGFDQQKLTLRHEYDGEQVSVASTLSMTNLNQETAGYIVGDEIYRDRRERNENPNPEAYRDTQSVRWASHIKYRLDDSSFLSFTPYARYTDMDFLQHFLPGTPLEENGQKSFGLQSAYHKRFDNWQIVTGLDLEYTDAFLKQAQDAPTAGSPFLMATIPEGKHYDYEVDAIVAAPFIHTSWQMTERLSMTAGLRYEVVRYDYDNRMLDGRTDEDGVPCGFGGCRYSRPADRFDRFESWSPKFGLVYDLADDHQVYLNLAQGFRAPQATELYRLQNAQDKAHLESEEVLSAEIGARGQYDRLSYEIALYAMKKRHEIFQDSSRLNVDDGEIRSRGIEVGLGYRFNEQWDMALAASYAEHEYSNHRFSGSTDIYENDVDGAPHDFGSARVGWNFLPGARAELEWVHQGEYYTDPENEHSYDGHNIFNLYSFWRLNPAWKLNVRVTNLLDRKYAERADYTSFGGDRYFPGEPRALYVGVERKW
ncbi:TonB-dependent receptor [Porticoccus litoralis]|uniref:TonB-dependent receptor n=1 Tax=Porticoccus litoralis TaxID=434086 RepID=A0AAW8B4R3_9GAMM|nr:TonB-dependent receptor [Porticoccus litoralis]MDP1520960.1 TonB-dependent receptor [Porticoccus litoralis]